MNQTQQAYQNISSCLDETIEQINIFCHEVLRTRGGRIGSGMGSLLEALWGYNINRILAQNQLNLCEMAWFPDHQYHDFACIQTNTIWNPHTRNGEFFRVEVKSMNRGADEPKAHFDVLHSELDEYDALLLLVWDWVDVDEYHCCPQIVDSFFDRAKPIVHIRDKLHLARGGSFVDGQNCPDRSCAPSYSYCRHHNEPLNVQGSRERITGPKSTRPSRNVSHSANFGGLVRMLKTRGQPAKDIFRFLRRDDHIIDKYISFIHRNFPAEELNHFNLSEWRQIGQFYNYENSACRTKEDIHSYIISQPNYQSVLKNFSNN